MGIFGEFFKKPEEVTPEEATPEETPQEQAIRETEEALDAGLTEEEVEKAKEAAKKANETRE